MSRAGDERSAVDPPLDVTASCDVWFERTLGRRIASPHDREAVPTGLDREQLAFVFRAVDSRRSGSEYARAYERALRETTPSLRAPKAEDPHEDLALIMSLPEMQRFWAAWIPERDGARGPKPSHAGSKAVMCVLAMTGASAQLDDAYHALKRDPLLRQAFERSTVSLKVAPCQHCPALARPPRN